MVVLGHGAGGGIEAPDLQALAAALPARGVEVVLVEQPWRVAGKRLGPRPSVLDAAWAPVVERLRDETASAGVPLVVGGRSAGARVACRTGLAGGASGVLALAFPLHPPGAADRSRADELLSSNLPTLIVQGARDPFGKPAEFSRMPATHRLVALRAGNHEFAVRKGEAPVLDAVTGAVAGWIAELVGS
jgi:predicted alpha/beta-hydrolase family hydrolase